MKVNKLVIKIFINIFVLLFLLITAVSSVANAYIASLNAFFGTSSFEKVNTNNDDFDSEYYKSAFVTADGEYADDSLFDYDSRVATQIMSESTVLLWNENKALPLSEGSAVSMFGNSSVNMVYTGSGSGSINVSKAVNMKDALTDNGFKVNGDLWNFYKDGEGSEKAGYGITQAGGGDMSGYVMNVKEVPSSVIKRNSSLVATFANYGDAAIFMFGRSGGEGKDILSKNNPDTLDGNYLQFSKEEIDVLNYMIELKKAGVFKKIVFLINSANAVQMDKICAYKGDIDACLWVGQPGAGGTPGIAKVLSGKANPSGRLVDTYCLNNLTSPAMVNMYSQQWTNASSYELGGTQKTSMVYQEGIYVGYKYYETRYEDVVLGRGNTADYKYTDDVAYPFGYGLSYSKYEMSDFAVEKNKDGNYDVTVTVTNVGAADGRHVAQVYLQKPYTDYDRENGIEKAAVELVGYAKTGVLKANGGKETLTITVDHNDFKSYDSNGYKTYIREAGDYYLTVAEDAHNAVNNILEAKSQEGIAVDKNAMVGSGDKNFAEKIKFDTLDKETYSVSQYTGVKITNQFDFADVNRNSEVGEQKITYLTRNDWKGTFPKEYQKLNLTDEMFAHLAYKRDLPEAKADADEYYKTHDAIKYDQKNGAKLINLRGKDYDDPEWDKLLDNMTWEEQALICARAYHATEGATSIDLPSTVVENGPLGVSVTFSTFNSRGAMGWPSACNRAATFNVKLNELMGKMFGEDLLHTDVNGCLGYGLNMHRTPYGARNFEYYAEDSFLSGETCKYETLGAQSKGAIIQVKHFVANDFDTVRNGTSTWMNEQTMREIYLSPFETEFCEGKALSTMVSTARIGNEWAGGSYNLCTAVLRGEWGFKGYTSSDYTALTRLDNNSYIGIQAGCDTYDAPQFNAENQYGAYKNDKYFQYYLRTSTKRIAWAVLQSNAMNGFTPSTTSVKVLTWWQKTLLSVQLSALCVSVVLIGLYVYATIKEKKLIGGNRA